MTATDRLRQLLDERGVKHKDEDTPLDTHGTLYRVTTTDDWVYEEPPHCDLLVRSRYDMGAEEAVEVEATLGRGTCKTHRPNCSDFDYDCESCGEQFSTCEPPNYCPSCGRRVES